MCDKNEKNVQNAEQNIPTNLPNYAESTLIRYTKNELIGLIRKHETIAEEWLKTYNDAMERCNAKLDKAIATVRESSKLLKEGNYVLDEYKKELKAKDNLFEFMNKDCINYLHKIKNLRITLYAMIVVAIILFFLVIL